MSTKKSNKRKSDPSKSCTAVDESGKQLTKAEPNSNCKKQKGKGGFLTKRTTEKAMGNSLQKKYTDKVYIQKETDKFVLFWQKESPFSQWYPSVFTVDELTFNCAEQYMMYNKALLSDDKELATKIMTEIDPEIQKDIGKQAGQLPSFDRKLWESKCVEVVRQGNIAKFSQNQRLKTLLLSTNPKCLAEASPFDTKWGIGLAANHADACNVEKWKGQNLLGIVLMDVRDELLKDQLTSKS